ncbi:trigger factor [Mycoplasma sp. SG1]|uniref:trigger factor n=1 Tax=Mycoplasma sp. SG1 TaxID=2810348 RepID=UPI00202463FF|nr:trigger factor [Mycoplasma sp. SG1]URM52772.1 trigger factor [Mycoplasma sp. SG1]
MRFTEKENITTLTGEYTFSSEGSDWQQYIKDAKKKLSKNLKIPGFRSEHIPDSVLNKKIPEANILQEAASIFAHKSYYHARENLVKYKVKPHNFNKIQTKYDVISKDSCQVSFLFSMSPVVKLGDWKKIKVKFNDYKVTDKEINSNIDSLLKRNSIFKLVEDKPAKIGDMVVISYAGKINDKSFAGGSGKNYSLELGSNQFIQGFEDQLVGLKAGDIKDIKVRFPDDYDAKNIAGKDAIFKVTVHEVKAKSTPTLDDTFVKNLKINGVETVDHLKESIKNELQSKYEKKSSDDFNEKIISELMKISEVKIPEMMLNEEYQQIVTVFDESLKKHNINRSDYLKTLNQKEDHLLAQFKKDAEARLVLGFIFKDISKKYNLTTTDQEIEDFFKLVAQQSQKSIEEVKNQIKNIEDIRFRLTNDKVWKLLVSDMGENFKNK